MVNMIVAMLSSITASKARVFPNGDVQFVMTKSDSKRIPYKATQLLSIRHLQLKGWELANTNEWEDIEE